MIRSFGAVDTQGAYYNVYPPTARVLAVGN